MAYKFSFADNAVYTAEDLNTFFSRLVTEGVTDSFADGVAYNTTQLNEAGARLYTSGAVGETANSLKVTKLSDGVLFIAPGTAFFSDGAVMEITEGGHEVTYPTGSACYVYLKNDLAVSNTCYPVCSVEEPQGDCVLLAEVLANGTVQDRRTYAKGKLPGYEGYNTGGLCIEDSVVLNKGESITKTYDIGNNRVGFVLAVSYERGICSLWRASDDTYMVNGEVKSYDYMLIWDAPVEYAYANFSIADGVLSVTISYRDTAVGGGGQYIPFTLYLF